MKHFFVLSTLLVTLFCAMASAQIPQTMNYQGILADAEGKAVADGKYELTYRIFNLPEGGEALWVETQSVETTNGVFNVILGKIKPLNLAFDAPYWLSVQVGDALELSPRIELTASAYSLSARSVEDGAITTAKLGDAAVTADKIASGQVARSINGLTDNIFLAAGENVNITSSGDTVTIAAAIVDSTSGDITAVNAGDGLSGGGADGEVSIALAEKGIKEKNIDDGQVVKSLNGLKDTVILEAGDNVSIIANENKLRISSTGTNGGGDITAVLAGEGLTGGGNAGEVRLSLASPLKIHKIAATDSLVIHVDGKRALRLEPATDIEGRFSPNVIGGFGGNNVAEGVNGATIGGGGREGNVNAVASSFATIGGGLANNASGEISTISGGSSNQASGSGATIGGGSSNRARDAGSTVGGGSSNTASGAGATVGGGSVNTVNGAGATIAGGSVNTASNSGATVGGGSNNRATGVSSTIGGGGSNTASGDGATVGGGRGNIAEGANSTVGGGLANKTFGDEAFVGGGQLNVASGTSATVAGGVGNTAIGINSTVGGGSENMASGPGATVPGGRGNAARGDDSFAAGLRARANHRGAFVWSNAVADSFASTGENQFLINATGGVGIGTNRPSAQLSLEDSGEGPKTMLDMQRNDLNENSQRFLVRMDPTNALLHFDVGGTGNSGARFHFGDLQTPANPVTMLGRVGIGTTSPSFNLHVNGTAGKPGGGSWSNASDIRLKDVRENFRRGLSAVVKLNPIYYSYKSDNPLGLPSDHEYVGLIAQEVEKVIPEAVEHDKGEYLHLNNDPIIWAMLNAIRELHDENAALKKEVDEQKAKMAGF